MTAITEIVIASKNQGKVKEIIKAFEHIPVKVLSLDAFGAVPDAVEDGQTFQENALIKARFYARITRRACLADDSGLEVDALQGEPGVHSARYAGNHGADAANNEKLLRELTRVAAQNSPARFRCALAFVDAAMELTCDACCEGTILVAPRGSGGFGYDPLFYVETMGKSMAELSLAEKNQISHRGAALRIMAKKLAGYLK